MQTGFVTNRASVPRNGATVARWSVTLTKVHRHEARRARHLAVGADAPDVMRVGEPHRHHAALAAARDGGVHRLARDRPPVAAPAVEHQEGAVVLHHLRPGVRHDQAHLQMAHVRRDHADAVTVVAHQVRAHQVVGDQVGLRGGASALLHDRADQASKLVGSRSHAFLLGLTRMARRPPIARPGPQYTRDPAGVDEVRGPGPR
jgi:hypothetical protein